MFCLYIIYSFDFLPQISHFEGARDKISFEQGANEVHFYFAYTPCCHNNEVRDLKADMVGRSSR